MTDIKSYLAEFDVFGYPLTDSHCGSCDQSLQEAMAAGVVPVVFNNPMELSMVRHNDTGLVAKNADEYIECIERLYNNPKLRDELSQNAKTYANTNYSLEKLNNDWNNIFDEILVRTKTSKRWEMNKENPSYFEIFLESQGDFANNFMLESEEDIRSIKKIGKTANWQSQTRGTVHQYHSFFSEDEELNKISKLMKD